MSIKIKRKRTRTDRISRFIQKYMPWLIRPVSDYYQQWVAADIREKVRAYALLMRLDRPIGIWLLIWPTWWALWLASKGPPSLSHLLVFSLGAFLMRSAGCVINDYADRDFDGRVKRTKKRPLAMKAIAPKEALILFAVLGLLAFLLVLMLNLNTLLMSFGAIAIAISYPFMKRYTYFPQVVLGAAFAWSVPMAFMAVSEHVPVEAWLLYLATLLWVLAYDTYYGMVDRADDMKIGIKSTAILFGDADLSIIAVIQGLFLFGMLLLGHRYELNGFYYFGCLLAAACMGYQYWIARKRKPDQCFKAFINNNYVGLFIFIGIIFSQH